MRQLLARWLGSWSATPDRGSFAPRLWSAYRRRITESGRLLLVVFGVSALVSIALVGAGYPLYQFATFLFVLILVDLFGGALVGARVEVARALPERVAAGSEVTVRAQVRNAGRLPVFDLAVGERIAARDHERVRLPEDPQSWGTLRGGEQVELSYRLTFLRRGSYTLGGGEPVTCFPFGLFRSRGRAQGEQRVLVTPRFRPLARLDLPVGQRHQPGGLQLVSSVGDSEEFVGCREYRTGDRLRDLDMRAWARVGFPVVREFNQEFLARVALVVDTHVRPRRAEDLEALEAAISLGAAVADVLSRQEYVIDIFAAGPDLFHLQAGRSLAYLESILDVLACIEANPNSPFDSLGPAILEAAEQISTAVVVFLDWDEDRLRFARTLQEHGVVLKVVVVRDGPPTLDPGPFGRVTRLSPAEVEAGVEAL